MSRPRGPSVDRPLAKLPEDVERALADVPCRLDGPFSYHDTRDLIAAALKAERKAIISFVKLTVESDRDAARVSQFIRKRGP